MDALAVTPKTLSLALEVSIGFVLGACIMRTLPRVIPSQWMIGLGLAGIGLVAITGALVYPFHERMLVLVAILASYVVAGAALRTEEVRSAHSADDLILLALALLSVATAGALLGYSLLAICGGFGSPTILVLAFAGVVMVATGFALVVLFIDRGGGKVNWRAAIRAAARVADQGERAG